MRFIRLVLVVSVVSVSFLFFQGRSAYAAFHCMRIHAVLGGFAGADTIQFVELRMNAGGKKNASASCTVAARRYSNADGITTHLHGSRARASPGAASCRCAARRTR